MSELARSDARAREAARSVFDRPLVLEAGAGTGKTTALVARVLAWCLGPGWERALADADDRRERTAARALRGVVAITFTEKAAADMGRRVGEALRDVAGGAWPEWLGPPPAKPERARERAVALRGALDHLTVQTIHAFCRRLLAGHALDAGLHPNLDVDADGRRGREIVREVLDDALASAYTEEGHPAYLALAARGIGPRDLEAELRELVEAGVAPAALERDPASPQRVAEFTARFEAALDAVRRPIAGRRGLAKVGDATADRLDGTAASLREQRPADAAQLQAWLRGLDWQANELARIAQWAKPKFVGSEIAVLGDATAELAEAARALRPLLEHALSLDLERLAEGRAVLAPLLARVDAALRERGVATFSALLTDARALLTSRGDAAARVRAEIDQLMVDEFQDTDDRQCDIVRAIALRGPIARRPGLFLVGDPKQSIYGWRNADLAAYDGFVAEVLEAGGARERLSVNYRSVPAVLDEVERCLAPVMVARRGVQPGFQPLLACGARAHAGGFDSGGFGAVEHWVPAAWDAREGALRRTRAVEASEIEARALAAELRALHDEHGVRWESVGVLFRSRTDWDVYLSALREAGVPYAVEGDRSYYRRREVIEAAALVRCVLDPDDALALLTWLRSAAVGVPDAALLPLWARALPRAIGALDGCAPDVEAALDALADTVREAARELPGDVPGLERIRGWEENLIDAAAAIAELRASFARDPSDVFVERLRTRTLLEATEAARYLGAWRCANLERFFRELRDRLDEAGCVRALLAELRRAVSDEEDAEEGRPVEMRSEAVNVMTIHAAKGLDFDHVYLMQLHKGSAARPRDARGAEQLDAAAAADGNWEYALFGAATLGWDRVLARRARVEEAERVRLLYVAMTRARDRLVMSGAWPELQSTRRPGQPIELLEGRAPEDLGRRLAEAAHAAGGGDGGGFRDASGARWSAPALAERAPAQRPLFAAGDAEPFDAPAADAAAQLARLRAEARARMQRLLGAAASGAAHREDPAGADPAEPDAPAAPVEPTGRARWARHVGTAIHRFFEALDFDRPLAEQLPGAREAVEAEVARAAGPADAEAALADARALLGRIAAGRLLERFVALGPSIAARELAVLCAPAGEGESDTGPVGYWSGAIDLVYRDPESGRIVIADYKTDRVGSDADLERLAAVYRPQGAVYQRALRDALGLDHTPRFELWFLSADRIVV